MAELSEKDELLREIRLAEEQLAEGQGVPHEEARAKVLESIGRSSRDRPYPPDLPGEGRGHRR